MRTILRRIVKVGFAAYALTAVAIAAFALLNPAVTPKPDIIVVLGAGMDPDGTLHRSSVLRVETAVTAFRKQASDYIHFTGGKGRAEGPSAGAQMAALAQSMGVPEAATSHEERSLSTLQNALFSQPMLAGARHITLVSEGFHLPRSWLSFKWAAWTDGTEPPRISLMHSERLRTQSPNARLPEVTMVLRESAALWFNAARVAAFELGLATGTSLN